MSKNEMIEIIADALQKAESQVAEVDKFTDRYPELNVELGYDIQDVLIKQKMADEKANHVGWKLGLTSVAKQQMMGVHEPTYGVLLNNMQIDEHEPISLSSFIHPKIEPEIAFVFEKELQGPVSIPEVLDATAYLLPAMEIIDSRYRNFKFTLADVVADNSSSSRFLLGSKMIKPAELDLKLCGMVFKKNGKVAATSAGAAVMGHPARAVAWLINKLSMRGESIKPGDIVLSGALCGSVAIEPGDMFTTSIDGLGSVFASFAE